MKIPDRTPNGDYYSNSPPKNYIVYLTTTDRFEIAVIADNEAEAKDLAINAYDKKYEKVIAFDAVEEPVRGDMMLNSWVDQFKEIVESMNMILTSKGWI